MQPLANIEHAVEIAASRERVWRVLTEEALVEQWLGCIGFKPLVGTLFYMQQDAARRAANDPTGATHCQIEAIEAQKRIRFSWFLPGTPKTYVEITLEDVGDSVTRVRLRHVGWDAFKPDDVRAIRDMLDGGWRSFVLPQLKAVAEAR